MHGFGLESGGLFSASEISAPVEFADCCQSCGTTLREFERRFLFGCGECSLVFGSLISNYLTLLGAGEDGSLGFYRGEPPKCYAERSKLHAIHNKINEKIVKEDYTGAAKFRDALNAHEKKITARRKKSVETGAKSRVSAPAASPEDLSRILLDTRSSAGKRDNWLLSQVEIRRNLADFKFPTKSDKVQCLQIKNNIFEYLRKQSYGAGRIELSELKPIERFAIGERFFHRRLNPNATAMINPETGSTVLINDADHVTAGAWSGERDPLAALEAARSQLQKLESGAELAFSQRFGYLTTAPKHIGTGLTVSVLLHLPYSFFHGRTLFWPENAENACVRLDSFRGKNLEHHGFFRVSSPVGFGRTAEEIASGVFAFAEKLVAEQQEMRGDFKSSEVNRVRNLLPRALDHAMRSYRLSYRDVLRLSTFIALADELGVAKFSGFSFDDVIPLMSSPFIMYRDGRAYSVNHCEKRRADLFAELVEKWAGVAMTEPAKNKKK